MIFSTLNSHLQLSDAPPSSQLTALRDGSPQLPPLTSNLFTMDLYTRSLLNTISPKVKLPTPNPAAHTRLLLKPLPILRPATCGNTTANDMRSLLAEYGSQPQSSPQPSALLASFFAPCNTTQRKNEMFRRFVLDFIVANNLTLQLADHPSFAALIQHISPTIQLPSRRTLQWDLLA